MNKSQLIELSNQIKSLETKRDESIKSIIKEIRKPIIEWATILPSKDFKDALENLYVESHSRCHGTDYFTWGDTKSIQDKFERYVKMIIEGDCEIKGKFNDELLRYHKNNEGDDKFFYYEPLSRFFNLKTFKSRFTTRSTHKTEKYFINKNAEIVYTYSGTAYHGFGSVDDSVQQELIIDMDKMSVIDYIDSTDKYSPRNSYGHKINTDFIDGWIDFSKKVSSLEK